MSEIPRYRMTNNYGHQDNENGSWIKYEDHVAAMQAARPQPKFKVGDQVVTKLTTKPWTITTADYVPKWKDWYYESEGEDGYETDLDLYVPPTPAELIPTLKEHEWVRGTTGEGEFMGTVFQSRPYPEGRGVSVGRQTLRHSHGGISRSILTIERCDAPVVVK